MNKIRMKKINRIITVLIILLTLNATTVQAHGGNITGWKDKNSDKIVEHNGKYFGYHKQDGERHYHEVEWNEEKQKWEIVKTAVYYDENFNIINIPKNEENEKVQVKFSEKVDGDTAKFELNGDIITVRFLGIDTPETVHPTKGEEPFGKDASQFTEEKLKNANKIELEYDNHASKTDKYERYLAWIWVDNFLLQEELIQNGLAKTYMLQDNYQYAGRLQEAEEEAKNQKLGIWSKEEIGNDGMNVLTTENANMHKVNQENILVDENIEKEKTEEIENRIELYLMIVVLTIGVIIKILKKKK